MRIGNDQDAVQGLDQAETTGGIARGKEKTENNVEGVYRGHYPAETTGPSPSGEH